MSKKISMLGLLAFVVLIASGFGLYQLGLHNGMAHGQMTASTERSDAPAKALIDPSSWGIPEGSTATKRHIETGLKAGDVDPITGRKILHYHDPMVPGKKFEAPGKSPFMDMMLVPAYAGGEGTDTGTISVSARTFQNLGMRTTKVISGQLVSEVAAPGIVAWNEYNQIMVQARATGFVEKLHVRTALDRVKKGQPLLELYVPDWIAVQEDYLTARQLQGNGLETLAQSARQRMRQAGMSEMQIAMVERSGQVQARVTLTAPVSGVVTDLMVREGSTVMTGDPLMGINDLSSVWVHAEVPESQATQILTGANIIAQTPAWPSKIFRGEVQSLLPEVSPTTRTRKARMLLVNKKVELVPGMFVQMQLSTGIPQEALLIPSEALVRTGKRTLVMLVDNGAFRPVEVKVGREQHYKTEVLSGLLLGQEVVVSGQFLIDSEASLKGVEARLSSDKESAPVDASAMPQLYHTTARVEAVSDSTVTLTHPDIPALKWPGMTMDFLLAPDVSRKLLVGEEISIEFLIREGDAPQIVQWQKNNTALGDAQ